MTRRVTAAGLLRFLPVVAALVVAGALLLAAALGARQAWASGSTRIAATSALLAVVAMACLGAAALLARTRGRSGLPRVELLLAAVTSVVCLGAVELGLSRLSPALTYGRAVELSPPIFRRSDILPFELRPGYDRPTLMRESGETVEFAVNPQGYRGPAFSPTKPADTFRLLVLGDSFAVNVAMPDEALYTVLLEQMLNESAQGGCRAEVINAGYADGYSPDAYVAYMLQKGFELAPDLVLMQYFVLNDFRDLMETEVVESAGGMPFRVRSRCRYVDDSGRFRRIVALRYQLPLLRDSHFFQHLWNLLGLEFLDLEVLRLLHPDCAGDNFAGPNPLGIRQEHVYGGPASRPASLQAAFERSMDYVRALHRETARRGVGFALFVVPSGVQLSREVWQRFFGTPVPDDWQRPSPQAEIAAALRGEGITILDPLSRYREEANRETLYLGADRNGHWTAAGNAYTARILFDFLMRRFPSWSRCAARAGADRGPDPERALPGPGQTLRPRGAGASDRRREAAPVATLRKPVVASRVLAGGPP